VNRAAILQGLDDRSADWDILVIGGGATGLGTAVDAAARGYRTVLLEQSDFAKATSSRSTKLIHGGIRYLRQGNVGLVLESLRERGLLLQNAPHLVHPLAFVIPTYRWWEAPYYGLGVKLYGALAGRLGIGRATIENRDETIRALPNIETAGLRGGVRYHDAQFDDARMAISLAQTATDLGAAVVNYIRVQSLLKNNDRVCGAVAIDSESGREIEIRARAVINATGIFTDTVRRLDEPASAPMLSVSQGAHIVLDRSFLPGDTALMVPKTDDGRVLFAIPWHDHVVVGTTETPMSQPALEPRPLEAEIAFLLNHAARYFAKDPGEQDILSVFAGLRPLVKSSASKATAALSRDHVIAVSPSGLVTIAGGKWTTYRKMAADAVDAAENAGSLPHVASRTQSLHLHGWSERIAGPANQRAYGTDEAALRALEAADPALGEPLHPRLPSRASEVVWAARDEMARTVDDVLSRRTRALFLDARAAIEAAPRVAALLAGELQRDPAWERQQVADFTALARGFLPAQS
jgi:glycerol-3-phosphate dehydrogenase